MVELVLIEWETGKPWCFYQKSLTITSFIFPLKTAATKKSIDIRYSLKQSSTDRSAKFADVVSFK